MQSSHWAMSSKEGVKYRAGEKQTETEGTEMKPRSDGEMERNKKKSWDIKQNKGWKTKEKYQRDYI